MAAAASSPSLVCVGGILMSVIARSGRSSRTRSISSEGVPHWPAISKPERSSRPASPSRRRTSSSASTTWIGLVLIGSIMGYVDAMGTSALVEEQGALRRVATLVAGGARSSEVFDAVAEEVAQVLHVPNAAVCRYDEDGTVMTALAVHGPHPKSFRPGSSWPLDGLSVAREILRTGRPQRLEDYAGVPGTLAAEAREGGFNVAGAPILVDGRVWGLIAASCPQAPLPDGLEERLAEFTGLVATAISNSDAHDELTRLAEEQAALRRVATLVAGGAPPAEVFEAVSSEVGALLSADASALSRYEDDGMVTGVSVWTPEGGYRYVGRRYPTQGTVSEL